MLPITQDQSPWETTIMIWWRNRKLKENYPRKKSLIEKLSSNEQSIIVKRKLSSTKLLFLDFTTPIDEYLIVEIFYNFKTWTLLLYECSTYGVLVLQDQNLQLTSRISWKFTFTIVTLRWKKKKKTKTKQKNFFLNSRVHKMDAKIFSLKSLGY